MPSYSKTEGFILFSDDICDGCDHFTGCNVYKELQHDEAGARYHGKHIVLPGGENNRQDYIGCNSYKPYTSPTERKDFNPDFGKRISSTEANRMDGLPDDTIRNDIR